jgi:hypothetical protein
MKTIHSILLFATLQSTPLTNAFSSILIHKKSPSMSSLKFLSASESESESESESASESLVDSNTDTNNDADHTPGDKVREANNIRPSLNPTVINTIANALLQRSTTRSSFIPSSQTQPIAIMVEAASLASKAIQSRAKGSTQVSGDNGAFTEEEGKLVAGRIVGVLMRLNDLEDELIEKVMGTSWVKKYGEESMFGVCNVELSEGYKPSDVTNIVDADADGDAKDGIDEVLEKLKDDPLLRMCRAECLYALFLRNVEMPSMAKIGVIPVDSVNAGGHGGGIDFLDQEKMEVLFPDGFE